MAAAFHWDSFFSGFVLSAFWAGYALTQILGGKLADKYGGNIPISYPCWMNDINKIYSIYIE